MKNKENTKTKHDPEKQTTQNTAKQNYPELVAFYDSRPRNEAGFFYNTSERKRGAEADTVYKLAEFNRLTSTWLMSSTRWLCW